MRIGFDAEVLTEGKTAAAVYLSRLVEGLVKTAPRAELFLFSSDKICVDYEPYLHYPQVHRIVKRLSREEKHRWPGAELPALLKEHEIEILHIPVRTAQPVFRSPCPSVITLLDIIPPGFAGTLGSWTSAMKYQWRNYLWARSAARVLAVTQTGKKDVMKSCRISDEHVVVTPLGGGDLSGVSVSDEEARQILKKYRLEDKSYVISISGLDRSRRKPDLILDAFMLCHRNVSEDLHFVFTGNNGRAEGYHERIFRKLDLMGLRDKVVVTGFIPDKVFKVILGHAKAAVITPMFTGTSLAVLEAFAAGVPVVAANRGAIPEIAGDAAILIDPYDPAALSDAIRQILDADEARSALVNKGFERVKQYSWERMAEETLTVYKSVLKQ